MLFSYACGHSVHILRRLTHKHIYVNTLLHTVHMLYMFMSHRFHRHLPTPHSGASSPPSALTVTGSLLHKCRALFLAVKIRGELGHINCTTYGTRGFVQKGWNEVLLPHHPRSHLRPLRYNNSRFIYRVLPPENLSCIIPSLSWAVALHEREVQNGTMAYTSWATALREH